MTWEPKSDADMNENRYNYFYIHNVYGNFVKDTLDYFSDYLYPRFQWKVIGTYDKAVEYINKTAEIGKEADQAKRPALILDPSGDFGFEEVYSKQLFRFPNLAPGFAKQIYQPIYQDENVIITVGFGRMIGELNFIGLMSSFYEYCDMRVYLNMIFGGQDRFIYPRWFNSFIILPSEIYNYEYSNDVTNLTYKLNIEDSYTKLIKTTNKNEVVYPCSILPRYKLTGISDGSTKYGGTDNIADWKLTWTLTFEVELPTFIILESDYLAKKLKVNIQYGSCYTENKVYLVDDIPVNIDSFDVNVDQGLDETSNSIVTLPDEATITNRENLLFKTRYYHIVTEEESESTTNVEFELPENIDDHNLISLYGKYGKMEYYDHYELDNLNTIIIKIENVTLEKDDVLEIFVYEKK